MFEDFFMTAACGLAVALLMLSAPKFLLVSLGRVSVSKLGGFRPFTPNWITVYSCVITLVGLGVYIYHPVPGILLIVFGAMLDRLDGRMAAALEDVLNSPKEWTVGIMGVLFGSAKSSDGQTHDVRLGAALLGRWWAEMNFPGATDLGSVLDPALDKVKILVIYAWFSRVGILSFWLVGALALPEIVGTLMRRPFYLWEGKTSGDRATSIGKYKAVFQWVIAILCGMYHQQWVAEPLWLPDAFLAVTIGLAAASPLSRLTWLRQKKEVKKVLGVLDNSVRHDE